ncbi:DUF5053 domain-containing protein [Ornithobacterium rhinotracheale]|uniref:DUF5053 domain-containing protein n=1 Tax=Ornithobacterium rhinotracheale TaxID=28251 RepID=UPI00293F33EA|nr:DUF5053 domain-containing protein [Ornithobacterium rhinotracheale]
MSEEYFEKSRSWLSQRMNGHLVNGKEATLSEDEIQTLKYALNDLGNRIIACAEKL